MVVGIKRWPWLVPGYPDVWKKFGSVHRNFSLAVRASLCVSRA